MTSCCTKVPLLNSPSARLFTYVVVLNTNHLNILSLCPQSLHVSLMLIPFFFFFLLLGVVISWLYSDYIAVKL